MLKSNGNKWCPFFKPFLRGNISGKFLRTRSLLYVTFVHNFIGLTSFIGIPNSGIILHKTSLLTEILSVLKAINSWCSALFYSNFSSSTWRIINVWSDVEMLPSNQYWWYPIISSAYRITFDNRVFNKILYVVEKRIFLYNYCNLFNRPT